MTIMNVSKKYNRSDEDTSTTNSETSSSEEESGNCIGEYGLTAMLFQKQLFRFNSEDVSHSYYYGSISYNIIVLTM